MDGVAINLHVALKPTSKFDGKKADEFLEWSSKLCASLRIYNNAFFNIFQGQERPSETDDGQATARAAWDAANHDLFQRIILFDGAQPSTPYGDSARHLRTGQDMDS